MTLRENFLIMSNRILPYRVFLTQLYFIINEIMDANENIGVLFSLITIMWVEINVINDMSTIFVK